MLSVKAYSYAAKGMEGNVMDKSCSLEKDGADIPPATSEVGNIIRRQGRLKASHRQVAEEVPVAFSYGGTTHAVMMASPQDIEDFAVGFSLCEGIIAQDSEIEAMAIQSFPAGIDVQMQLSDQQRDALTARRRHMAGPVGCGLCGIESITEAVREFPPVENSNFTLCSEQIVQAAEQMWNLQLLHRATGAVHAAGFYQAHQRDGEILAVREDVGRHNALDKLAGFLLRGKGKAEGADTTHGAVMVTSRVSLEMVQKTAAIRSPVILAISAPTALAIRTAEALNITLVALVRGAEFDVYTHPHRIVE